MTSFLSFIVESSKGGIQHIDHPSDKIFSGKEAADHAVHTLRGVADGSVPITKKVDDKLSYQTIRTKKGVGVKYKGNGSQYSFSPDEIDAQHKGKPYVAEPLKLLQAHLDKVLPKREGEWQGGFLSGEGDRQIKDGMVHHTPNTIEYSVPMDTKEGQKLARSKVSTVIHSELKGPDREAVPVTDTSEFGEHPDVHQMQHVVTHDEHHSLDPALKRQAHAHLDSAEKILGSHDFSHLAGHEKTLKRYINSLVGTGGSPTTEGYKAHLKTVHKKEVDSVKKDETKAAKKTQHKAVLAHVDKHAKDFDKTLKAHGHIQQATNLLSRALAKSAHGSYNHTINGKKTGPEGFVGGGLKIVDRGDDGFTAANRARSAILKASKDLGKKV